MQTWYIYILKDPRSDDVRYVGWTINPKTRLRDHTKPSQLIKKQHRDKWINSLIKEGIKPIMEIIEQGQGNKWGESEKKWITYYRNKNADLTNHTDGGEGTPGFQHKEQTKAQWRLKRKGIGPSPYAHKCKLKAVTGKKRPREVIEKWASKLRGKPKSLEHRAKLSAAHKGKKLSNEHKAKLRIALLGKKRKPMSQQGRKNISIAKKGKGGEQKRSYWASLTREQRSEICRRGHETRRNKRARSSG